jgi:hypothetical protein
VIALFEYKGNSAIHLKNQRTCRWVIGGQSCRNNLKKAFRMKNSVVYSACISAPVDLSTGRFWRNRTPLSDVKIIYADK